MAWLPVVGISLSGIHTVASAGTTGGPNHGEHPFLVTVLHGLVFFFGNNGWPLFSRQLYWGGLALALALSLITLRHTFDDRRGWLIPMRLALGLVYVGFLVIYFRRP